MAKAAEGANDTIKRVLQVVGYKNSGKTTLVCRMAERLSALGCRVGTVKHDSHGFEPDRPGTDTWRHLSSGVAKAAITSPDTTVLFEQNGSTLDRLLHTMDDMDVVLVEGFKQASYPKFLMIRSRDDLVLLECCRSIVAVVSWIPLDFAGAPVFRVDDTERILRYMANWLGVATRKESGRWNG